MAIADDISIANNGDIRRTGDAHGGGSPGYYSVIEFHRYLMSHADDLAASGDDLMDITKSSPSERSTDNIITLNAPYNIDDDLAEYLYDGSIIQDSQNTYYDGVVNYGNATFVEVVQNGAYITNDFWNTYSPTGFNADAVQGISHRFLVKTRTGGSDIDGRRLLGITHEFGNSYGEFAIAGTNRGNNVLALSQQNDLNNATAVGTVATWTTITNLNQGYVGIDGNGDTVDEFYYGEWDLDTYTKSQFYERMKYLTRRGSTETLYGLDQSTTPLRGITHEFDVDTPTGTFNAFEQVSWGTGPTAGTAQMLAINSTTAATKMWVQLLTGVVPTDGLTITGATSTATVDLNVTVTPRTLSFPFCGATTGSNHIGAYGFGITESDLVNGDQLFDLTNTQRLPPNNVTFNVTGHAIGDTILVSWEDAGDIDRDQLSLSGPISGAAVGTITVQEAIPSDTPQTGTIRVVNDSGFEVRLPYTSWATSTFTLTSTYDFSGTNENDGAADGNNVYITYIDRVATATTESFTVVYNTTRSLFVRGREGTSGSPIKPFDTTGSLGSSGGTATIIRTDDF